MYDCGILNEVLEKKPSIFAAAKFVTLISGIHQEKIVILK